MEIVFNGVSRNEWLTKIVTSLNVSIEAAENVNILFNDISNPEELEPFHFVLLACLIHYLDAKGVNGEILMPEGDIFDYFENLQFNKFLSEGMNYIKAQDDNVFNLWKITDEGKETYCIQVHDYLINSFFRNKDLSAVQNSLAELYYNVFDHAVANGNAYSFIKYNETTEKLYVAICDFGKGIASSIRSQYDVNSDKEAIQKAIEKGISVHSQTHNKGFGLDNILSTLAPDDKLRIISNSGFLFAIGKTIKTFDLDFCFNGTLIYYELSLSVFEDEEMNEMMTFD